MSGKFALFLLKSRECTSFFSDQLNLRIVANCFVSWILITASPVVGLAKFVVRGVIKAGHLCLIEFYGSDLQIHSTQQ